ncbi:hypothetical protein [Massilicoli timonensis]|uniref:hypothetical protein n=1 Tax=Massilicoli timonensis TaxID=2015901 RepID=UPI000C85AFD1|nr:hypothetical protein [Massilicoli timonensis]
MRKNLNLPLYIIIFYLIFTLVIYIAGPFNWITYNPIYFWGLQLLYLSMIIFGWKKGVQKKQNNIWSSKWDLLIIKYLRPLLIINFIYELVNIFRRFGFSNFNFIGLINKVVYGLFHMGESYNTFQESIGEVSGADLLGGNLFTVFNLIWECVAFLVLLLSIIYFKKLTKRYKVITISTILISILAYLSTGTNIGLFRIIFPSIIIFIMKLYKKSLIWDRSKKKRLMKIILVIVGISFILVAFIFDMTMKSRGGILYFNDSSYNIGGISLNKDSIFFKIVPESLYMLLVAGAAYLTQGYYGMSLCLRIKWIPTFGIGSSMYLQKFFSKYITDDFLLNSYQSRLQEFGWDPDIRWHSAYSWIANDVSFLGVGIIIFAFAYLFAMAYKDVLETDNPFAITLVCLLSLAVFFIPCNNQLFQTPYTMFAFFVTLILWRATKANTKIYKWSKSIYAKVKQK